MKCSVDGCERPVRHLELCLMHYTRQRRHGNLEGLRPFAAPDVRFERYVDRSRGADACWIWTGVRNNHGYGSFLVSNTPHIRKYAHRYAYEQIHGEIPLGMVVMHACDNPPCVNPAHLSAGTNAENMQDMAAKGRSKRATCRRGHEWTEENTRHFTDSRGFPNRRCRQCRRERERAK